MYPYELMEVAPLLSRLLTAPLLLVIASIAIAP